MTPYNFIQHQLKTNPFLRDSDAALIEALATKAVRAGATILTSLDKAAQCERTRLAIGSGDWMRSGGHTVSAWEHRQLWLNYLSALRAAELA